MPGRRAAPRETPRGQRAAGSLANPCVLSTRDLGSCPLARNRPQIDEADRFHSLRFYGVGSLDLGRLRNQFLLTGGKTSIPVLAVRFPLSVFQHIFALKFKPLLSIVMGLDAR